MSRALVGRTDELARVRRAVESRSAVFVVGEPGIGKSALCRAALDGMRLAVGRASASATAPFRSLTEVALAVGGEPPAHAPAAVRAVLTGDSAPSRGDRSAVVGVAVGHHLAALVSRSGVACVLLEDLHWSDPETLDAVQHLVEADDRPWALVGTLRPEGAALAAVARWSAAVRSGSTWAGCPPTT